MLAARLRHWLSHPSMRDVDLDDPRTTAMRRDLVRSKPLLRHVYEDWYQAIADRLPSGPGPVVEIGSGPGFLREFIPGLITSEVLASRDVRVILDARRLPFAVASLRAVVMTNVLHHLPEATAFFADAARCVRPGGAVVMIEPWVSPWSRIVYTRLHHEPFDPAARRWDLTSPAGPLTGANGALPWILFSRDRARFEAEHPEWSVESITPCTPFRYLLSGGVSMRSLVPRAASGFLKRLEGSLGTLMPRVAMFAVIVLVRRHVTATSAHTP